MPPPDPLPGVGPVDHLGIAVRSLEEGKALYGKTLGLRLLFEEEVPSERVRVAGYDGGGLRIELLESTDPDGPIARHVALVANSCGAGGSSWAGSVAHHAKRRTARRGRESGSRSIMGGRGRRGAAL